MFAEGFFREGVEATGCGVGFQLPIPALLVALGHPIGEFAEVGGREVEDFGFELFESDGESPRRGTGLVGRRFA